MPRLSKRIQKQQDEFDGFLASTNIDPVSNETLQQQIEELSDKLDRTLTFLTYWIVYFIFFAPIVEAMVKHYLN